MISHWQQHQNSIESKGKHHRGNIYSTYTYRYIIFVCTPVLGLIRVYNIPSFAALAGRSVAKKVEFLALSRQAAHVVPATSFLGFSKRQLQTLLQKLLASQAVLSMLHKGLVLSMALPSHAVLQGYSDRCEFPGIRAGLDAKLASLDHV